jgi:hypothetical protein
VRLGDGLVVAGKTGDPSAGLLRTLVPPGHYRLRVGGGFSAVEAAQREVDVPGPGPQRFVLDPAATLRLSGLDPAGPEGVALLLPDGEELATSPDPQIVHLPHSGPAAIVLERGGPIVRPVGPFEDGFRTAIVPPRSPVTVRLVLRSADPNRALEVDEVYWADLEEGEGPHPTAGEGGRWIFRTFRRGRRVLEARARGFQTEQVEVSIGPEDREVDVGDVFLHPLEARTLTVRDADGAVVNGLTLYWGWGKAGAQGTVLPKKDGTFALSLGPRPVPAVLEGNGIYPVRFRLGAAGPLDFCLPAGRLVLNVNDSQRHTLDFVAYVDDVRIAAKRGRVDLVGVPIGKHTVIVGAPSHYGAVRQVDVQGAHTIDFSLASR